MFRNFPRYGVTCGWYYLPGPLTDVRLRAMFGAGVEVFVRRGQLFIRMLNPMPALYKGFPLHPDDETDPYAFRIDFSEFGLGTVPVVFSREPDRSHGGPLRADAAVGLRAAAEFESETLGRRCNCRRRYCDPCSQPARCEAGQTLARQMCIGDCDIAAATLKTIVFGASGDGGEEFPLHHGVAGNHWTHQPGVPAW